MIFPNAFALTLPIVNPDHSPITFIPIIDSTSGRRFKFEAMWQGHLKFNQLLSNCCQMVSNANPNDNSLGESQ